MKWMSKNTPQNLARFNNNLLGFVERRDQRNLRQEVDEAGQFAMQMVSEMGERAMTPEGVQEIARSMSEKGFKPQAAMIGVKAAMEYTRMFAEAQSRQQQNTLFGQQQEQYGRQTARENQSFEAEDILNRISLMGQGANTGLMPQTGEGAGLSSMGVPANDAARMGQTKQGLLDTLIENPIAGKGYTNMQAQQAEAARQAQKDALDAKLTNAKIGNYESLADYNQNVRGRGKSTGIDEDTAWADLAAKYNIMEGERSIMVPKSEEQAVRQDIESNGFSAFPGETQEVDRPGMFNFGSDEMVEIRIGGYHGRQGGLGQSNNTGDPGPVQQAQPQTFTSQDEAIKAAEALDKSGIAVEVKTNNDGSITIVPMGEKYQYYASKIVQSIQDGKGADVIPYLDKLPKEELHKILANLPPEARQALRDEYQKRDKGNAKPKVDFDLKPSHNLEEPTGRDPLGPLKDVRKNLVSPFLDSINQGATGILKRTQRPNKFQ